MPSAVHVHLQLRIVGDDGTVFTDSEILHLEKSDHRLEAVGLSISDSKTLQKCLQQHIVTAQAAAFVDRHRCCPACGRQLCRKGKSPIVFRTVFGNVSLSSPRFYRCGCQPADSKTFSPLTELFTEHVAPELLYLETRWASLISFGMTAALLKDVLPVADTTNPETVRQHLHKVAVRQDTDLGTDQPSSRDEGSIAGQASPIAREAVIVGIDGGYLRNWHDKRKKFEVIVGKSMAEDRDDRYFGCPQPGCRTRAPVLRGAAAPGVPADQPVTVLPAATASARSWATCRPAASIIDWFHIAMRLTVLGQYAKGLAHHNPIEATALQDRLERIKWRLWHGDAGEALSRARELAGDVAALASGYPGLTRLVKATAGLDLHREQCRRDHRLRGALGPWRDHLDCLRRIHRRPRRQPALCQEAADAVVEDGAHRLLQTRTRTLDGTLRDLFTTWYPAMPANEVQPVPFAAAA